MGIASIRTGRKSSLAVQNGAGEVAFGSESCENPVKIGSIYIQMNNAVIFLQRMVRENNDLGHILAFHTTLVAHIFQLTTG